MTEQKESPLGGGAPNVHVLRLDRLERINKLPQRQVLRIADDPVIQRAVDKIYAQGSRMVLELLNTLAEQYMLGTPIEREIKRHALLPDGALHQMGCDTIRYMPPLQVPPRHGFVESEAPHE